MHKYVGIIPAEGKQKIMNKYTIKMYKYLKKGLIYEFINKIYV